MIYSYSALAMFRQCPKRFEAHYLLDVAVKRISSPALERGNRIHKALEVALQTGVLESEDPLWLPDGMLERLRDGGARAEVPLAIDGDGKAVGFWDKRAVLRGKVDVLMATDRGALVADWKTGKFYPDDFQAAVYAYLLRSALGAPELPISFLWLFVDPSVQRAKWAEPGPEARYQVQATIAQVETAKEFPAKPSPLCRFCGVTWCQFNEE